MSSSDSEGSDRRTWAADLAKISAPLLAVLALAAAWQLTPLAQLGPEIRDVVSSVREMPWSPLIVIAAFVAGGLVVAPVSVLMLATVVAFGPIRPRRRRRLGRPLVGATDRPVIRVGTYNVHGFVGRDGRRDPAEARLGREGRIVVDRCSASGVLWFLRQA